MGVSLFLVWDKKDRSDKGSRAVSFFFIQLGLNTLWSVLFFGLRSPLAGFIGILMLWPAILVTMVQFFKLSSWAGYLFMPYLLWVSFALVLNFNLWTLN